MATARRGERQNRPAGHQPRAVRSHSRQPTQPASGRATDAVDVHVGSSLRLARKTLGMTQEALAAQLGITFQQLQKYEKGINRISAGRLHRAAGLLGVPVSFFFPDAGRAPQGQPAVSRALAERMSIPNTIEGIELNRAFAQINDATVRKRVLDLVRSIALSTEECQEP